MGISYEQPSLAGTVYLSLVAIGPKKIWCQTLWFSSNNGIFSTQDLVFRMLGVGRHSTLVDIVRVI